MYLVSLAHSVFFCYSRCAKPSVCRKIDFDLVEDEVDERHEAVSCLRQIMSENLRKRKIQRDQDNATSKRRK